MALIWGLDLSLRSTGIVVLEEGKVIDAVTIRTKPKVRGPARWNKILEGIAVVYEVARPDLAVLEGIAYGSHTACLSAELSALVRYYLYKHEIAYKMVAPGTLKKITSSKGNANKKQMAEAVKRRWHLEFEDDHQVDAFCLAKLESMDRFSTIGIHDWRP